MTDEEVSRMLGSVSGMAHALVMLKMDIGYRVSRPIPSRHTKRIREREMQVAPLRAICTRLEADLRRLQAAIAEHT